MISDEGGLANAFIYLKRKPEGIEFDNPMNEAEVRSLNHRFEPHCQIVHTNQPIRIRNLEPFVTNANYKGIANTWNVLGPPKADASLVAMHARPERIPCQISDDFYPWKLAYLLTLDHPFGAVTDENGNFNIDGLPPGKHAFVVWHEKVGYLERSLEVEIRNDGPTEIRLSYHVVSFVK